MYKFILALLLVTIVGCGTQRIDTNYEALVANITAEATANKTPTPTPTPEPTGKHKRKDCPTGGWITHGDGHKTPCPDCIDEMGNPYWTIERVETLARENPEFLKSMLFGKVEAEVKTEDCPDGICPIKPKKSEPQPEVNTDKVELPKSDTTETVHENKFKVQMREALDKYYAELKARRDKKETEQKARTESGPPKAASPAIYGEWNNWLWVWDGEKWNPVRSVNSTLRWSNGGWVKRGSENRSYSPSYNMDGGCSGGSCSGGSCGSGGFRFFGGGCSSCGG